LSSFFLFFFLICPPHPFFSLFPYTTLFRSEGFSPLSEVLLDSFAQIEARAANQDELTGLGTGFIDLDNKLSGLQKSDLILLAARDRKSTRLNSSHVSISYAVFCLKKKIHIK